MDQQLKKIQSRLPNNFSLSQNYPNPFNSTTQIRFQLASFQKVNLKIFNPLGQEVRTLVNEERPAGYFQTVWDGKDNSGVEVGTGIYLCLFQAGEYFESRKILYLK